MCVNLLNRVFIADIFFLQHIFQMNTSREQDCEECNQINIHPQAQARRLPRPPMTRSQSSPEVTVIQTASPARRFFHMLPVAACRLCLKQEATTPPLSTTTQWPYVEDIFQATGPAPAWCSTLRTSAGRRTWSEIWRWADTSMQPSVWRTLAHISSEDKPVVAAAEPQISWNMDWQSGQQDQICQFPCTAPAPSKYPNSASSPSTNLTFASTRWMSATPQARQGGRRPTSGQVCRPAGDTGQVVLWPPITRWWLQEVGVGLPTTKVLKFSTWERGRSPTAAKWPLQGDTST